MITAKLPKRGTDDYGSGEFGASRGNRTHNGIDFAVLPGSEIFAPVDGYVSRIGYPYADDLSYRYVQITDRKCRHHRIFYIDPKVELGDNVSHNVDIIGVAQGISARYTERGTMKNHVHYEIMENGKPVDPELFWNGGAR